MFSVHGLRIYVRADGSDDEDGLTWDTAKQTVQEALDIEPGEVWVAEGTYVENLNVSNAVALYGGFAGDEESVDDRDLDAHTTTLDGDANGSVLTSTDEHVIRLLDGFTLTNGAADSGRGGGAVITGFRGSITNVVFRNNTASDAGGGLYLESKDNADLVHIVLDHVTFENNASAQGGGLFTDMQNNPTTPDVQLSHVTFHENIAFRGGGAYLKGNTTFHDGADFTDNSASMGGGLYIENYVEVNGGTFTGNGMSNSSENAAGGAVCAQTGAYFNGSNIQFADNHVSAAGKSAVGGAIAGVDGGYVYLFACTLSGNSAGLGGAVYAALNGASLNHCILSGNAAAYGGGAVYIKSGAAYLENNLIWENTANEYGGGVVLDASPLYLSPASPARLLNNTIADNAAPGGAGVDVRNGSNVLLQSNIVAYNSAGVRLDATSSAMWFNNDVFGNASAGDVLGAASPVGANGNISADPKFVDRAGGNYRLGAGSPAIDAGDSGPYGPYYQDLAFTARLQGTRVDIGAYESAGAAAVILRWDANPAGGPSPGVLTAQPVVRVVDYNGNTLSAFSGSVTIALKPGTGTVGATLGGTTTVPVVNGVATFTNLSLNKGGTGYVLTASVPGFGGADSPPVTMTTPIVRVALNGSDGNDGASWAAAKRNPQAAVDQAAAGGAVWLQAGTYTGVVTTRGASMLGGFAGTETDPAQRTPGVSDTVLDANHLTDAINVQSNGGAPIAFNSLTVRNARGAGVLSFVDDMTVSGSVFTGSTGGFGGGVLTFGNNVTISRNRFLNNAVTVSGGGVYALGATKIVDNLFAGNSAPQDGSAITASASGTITLVNNTIVGGIGPGGAVQLYGSPAVLANNIVANNASGINRSAGSSASLTVTHNDVFANAAFNYQNLDPGSDDISADPRFVNPAAGDYRLGHDSPAVDAGSDAYLSFGALDLAGAARKLGAHVDMGALEAQTGVIGVADAIRALQIAGGLLPSAASDLTVLNVENTGASQNRIDVRDAVRLMRKAIGTDANP
jgi:hypothetical protein